MPTILIVIGITLISFILGFCWLMLFFMMGWQILVMITIIRNAITLWKTRKGLFVEGRLHRSVARSDHDGMLTRKALIVFSLPDGKGERRIIHQSQFPPPNHYKIWVDQCHPEKSVVTNDKGFIIFNDLFFLAVVIGLCFADYFCIMKIIGK